MIYKGPCTCGHWQASLNLDKALADLSPRICDCDYCQKHPSMIASDPGMTTDFSGSKLNIRKNGDQLANFYYCSHCDDMLAVGCELNGTLRGAVNITLFGGAGLFGEPMNIQPRLLKSSEKLERWSNLWGELTFE